MVVRVSTGHFEPSQLAAVERTLEEGGSRLIPAIQKLPGCRHYYAALQREANAIINVSVWDSLEHAAQMGSLEEMRREGALMRSLGVRFEPILNYETAWTITG